jgi:hypothetical protein
MSLDGDVCLVASGMSWSLWACTWLPEQGPSEPAAAQEGAGEVVLVKPEAKESKPCELELALKPQKVSVPQTLAAHKP